MLEKFGDGDNVSTLEMHAQHSEQVSHSKKKKKKHVQLPPFFPEMSQWMTGYFYFSVDYFWVTRQ